MWEWERCSGDGEHWLLFQRIHIQFPAPIPEDSQLPVTPAPGDPTPSSCLWRRRYTHTQRRIHIHKWKFKNKSLKNTEYEKLQKIIYSNRNGSTWRSTRWDLESPWKHIPEHVWEAVLDHVMRREDPPNMWMASCLELAAYSDKKGELELSSRTHCLLLSDCRSRVPSDSTSLLPYFPATVDCAPWHFKAGQTISALRGLC